MLFNFSNGSNKKQKIIIFGTGSGAIKFIKLIKNTHKIVCFMDNDIKKQGKNLNGVPIYHPNKIIDFPNLSVVVASEFYDEIYAQLQKNANFRYTNIIYYRALNVDIPILKKLQSASVKTIYDIICKTPRLVIPIVKPIFRLFRLNLAFVRSLDCEERYVIQPLRSTKQYVSFGPSFIDQKQNQMNVTLPPVALYQFSKCYMSINSRAFCIGHEVIIEKTHTISDKVAKYNKGHLIHHFQDSLAIVKVDDRHPIKRGILINGYYDQNYYHWIIDIIPQLAYISELNPEYKEYPILISDMANKIDSIRQLISFFNLTQDIIYLSHDNIYKVEDLLIVSSPNRCCPRIIGSAWSNSDFTYSREESIFHLRDLVLKECKDTNDSLPKKVFLAPSMKHRKYNREEVFRPLQALGFVKINPEKMTLIEQAMTFNHADIIVGPTGATWTNLIFAKNGAKALCWMAEEWGDFSAFSNLAKIIGVQLDYLTYAAGVDDHVDLYSQAYVVDNRAILDWAKRTTS